jgi:predicted TIM-barrel fold metal-dependent hydrolase
VEEPLEPELRICDSHHHLWPTRKYGVEQRYLLNDYLTDVGSGHNVRSSVYVTCGTTFRADGPERMRCLGEVEFVNGQAAISASGDFGTTRVAEGIVGTAYLREGAAVGEVLDALIAVGGGRFRGIREGAAWHASPEIPNHRTNPPPNLLLDPRFREGFAQLARRSLSFEAWCYHTQLEDLIDLARHFPDTTIVLDHFGGPLGIGPYAGKRDEVLAQWTHAITRLAACPNVVAKLGGIHMEIAGFAWQKRERPPGSRELMEATRPFYDHAIAAFGVDRCMFESNFPVDKVSVSYGVLWNSFKRLTAGYSKNERAKLFHDNAVRVYRLPNRQESSVTSPPSA